MYREGQTNVMKNGNSLQKIYSNNLLTSIYTISILLLHCCIFYLLIFFSVRSFVSHLKRR